MIRPEVTALTEPYWTAAARGEVLLQRCRADGCGRVWHPPAPTCPADPAHPIEWFAASGRGRLHSYTRVEHAAHPAVVAALPYVVALVELEEGPLLIVNLIDTDPADTDPADTGPLELPDGLPVEISLGRTAAGAELPVARPAARPVRGRGVRDAAG